VSVSAEPNNLLGARAASVAAKPGAMPGMHVVPDFVSRSVLGLEVVALSVGVLQFVFAPSSVSSPLLAAGGLVCIALCMLAVRLIPRLQRSLTQRRWFITSSLVLGVTLLVTGTGGATHSVLASLYTIPLATHALTSGRWPPLIAIGGVSALACTLASWLNPQTQFLPEEFAVLLLSILGPGVAIAVILARTAEQIQSDARRINDLASTDALTGLLNLHAFEQVLQREHRNAARLGRCYTLIIVDADNVQQTNEQLGHEAGSQIIISVAAAIGRSIRANDIAARLGGDEFVVLLADTDARAAAPIAQRVRNNIYAGTVSVANRLIRANASLGTACFPEDHAHAKELMIVADQRMQQDRLQRRNKSEAR
jgi:diguanylate cyclase (GGDEF)-like protein